MPTRQQLFCRELKNFPLAHRNMPAKRVKFFLNYSYPIFMITQKLITTKRLAVYLETHCSIGSKRALSTGVLDRWHNCVLIYRRTSCLFSAFDDTLCHVLATEWSQPYLPCYLLNFQFSLHFVFAVSQAAAAACVIYPISDIGRFRKYGKYVSCTWLISQQNYFELILTAKMETEDGLKSQDLKILWAIFWKNDP